MAEGESSDSGLASTKDALDDLIRQVARTPLAAHHKRPGDTFCDGRYCVVRLLGEGGQKIVFLVRDSVLDRECALSLIRPHLLDTAQLERFRAEARSLARVGAQPNIVTIYDLGEDEGVPYVLCEYLEGGDLRAAIADGAPMDVERVLRIARDVCRGLAFAHERGVIHRDVTPANIWLVSDGSAKLGDFGLALVSDQTRLTQPGGVLGTASYLAPEQAMGRPVDERTDIYALGCVLYELVTGQPPYVGDSPIAVVSQHIHAEPVAPDSRNQAVGPKLSALILRMLAKDPEQRPASAQALVDEIDRLIASVERNGGLEASGAPIPANERGRLAALHSYGILDTPPEPVFDEIAELAAQICGCSMAYVSFIDETRQWMKARCGIPAELASAPREVGVCQTTICQADVLIVPDLAADDRFSALPPVSEPPHLRFYSAAPLLDRQGHALGTLCVMDVVPRQLSFQQAEALRVLSRQVMAQLDLRQTSARLAQTSEQLAEARAVADASRQKDQLLRSVLPEHVVQALAANGSVEPRYYESVTLGIARFSDFEQLTARLAPADLVRWYDEFVRSFDEVLGGLGVEKLSVSASGYAFAAGLAEPAKRHPVVACQTALGLRQAARLVNEGCPRRRDEPWRLQIVLHTGPATVGVVGTHRPAYDVWGQAATVAARIHDACAPGQILGSESTYQRTRGLFEWTAATGVAVENRGTIATYLLERIRPELSADAAGIRPNARFDELVAQQFGATTSAG